MSGKTLTLAILVGGLALLILAFSLEIVVRAFPSSPRLWDRQELQNVLLGGSPSDVVNKLGEPDLNTEKFATPETPPGNAIWIYYNRTKNPQTGRPDPEIHVWFENGQVRRILFDTMREIPEHRPAVGPGFAH